MKHKVSAIIQIRLEAKINACFRHQAEKIFLSNINRGNYDRQLIRKIVNQEMKMRAVIPIKEK